MPDCLEEWRFPCPPCIAPNRHDHDDSGEVMLVFEDTAHCHVTIRLHPACLKLLIQRLAAEPDNHPIGE